MKATRIVTSHNSAGQSEVLSSGPVAGDESFVSIPGFSAALVWKTQAGETVGGTTRDVLAEVDNVLPDAGGTCGMFVTFPPQQTDAAAPSAEQIAAMTAEMLQRLPGLAPRFEQDDPGFHATDTIDYGVLLEGQLTLELDSGEPRLLNPGDVVVQMGTRHAWRNRGNKPARMFFVMIDAARQ